MIASTLRHPFRRFSSLTTDRRAYQKLKPAEKKVLFNFLGFDRLNIWSNNSTHTAHFFCSMLGFHLVDFANAYTGQKHINTFFLQNGNVRLRIDSPISAQCTQFTDFLAKHGDSIHSVASRIDDVDALASHLMRLNEKFEMTNETEDRFGAKKELKIHLGEMTHSFVERGGPAQPGHPHSEQEMNYAFMETNNKQFGDVTFGKIDHVGIPQHAGGMKPAVNRFYDLLGFYHFWSVDDKVIFSDKATLNSTVISSFDESVKFPIFEPVQKLVKSQIQEFIDYNGGPGVQHVAITVKDIIAVVKNLRSRGLTFLKANPSYYEIVEKKLKECGLQLKEDMAQLKELDILIDFDRQGYLLQIFTHPVMDRPTLFFEFIQRENHEGFGEGNFQRLFESIEMEQKKRGNFN